MLKKILKEPLVHFLVLGALLFALSGDEEPALAPADNEIRVEADLIISMRDDFTEYWRRPPTDEELQKLIDDFITEEVLYREARLIGLDQEDPVIRARLAHEMGMLAETDLEALEPDDETLQQYMQENTAKYRRGDSLSLRQLFFGAVDDPAAAQAAESSLETIQAADKDFKWKNLGDPIGLPSILERLRWREVSGLFGDAFRDQIIDAPVTQWFGPITSKYGTHLVYLIEREEGYIPEFDIVREIVLRDWETEQHLQKRDAYFAELREKYAVKVEELPPDAPETVESE